MTDRLENLILSRNLRLETERYHRIWLDIHTPYMTEEMKSSWEEELSLQRREIETLNMQIEMESANPRRSFARLFA